VDALDACEKLRPAGAFLTFAEIVEPSNNYDSPLALRILRDPASRSN